MRTSRLLALLPAIILAGCSLHYHHHVHRDGVESVTDRVVFDLLEDLKDDGTPEN